MKPRTAKTSVLSRLYLSIIFLMPFGFTASAQYPYRFFGLNDGVLISNTTIGQDGWRLYPGSTAANGVFEIRLVDATGRPGVKALKGFSPLAANISRKNDSLYSFPAFSTNQTAAVSMFDIRYRNITSGNFTGIFGLGKDGDNANEIIDQGNELGPTFGLQALYIRNPQIPPSFYLRGAGFGTEYFSPITSDHATDGEWLRIKLTMNFIKGTGSLSYRNLTRGDIFYKAIHNLQNIPLQLERLGQASTPEKWNAMYIRSAENGGDTSRSFEMCDFVPYHRDASEFISNPYTFDDLPAGTLISNSSSALDGWALFPGSTHASGSFNLQISPSASGDGNVVQGQSLLAANISRKNDVIYSFPTLSSQQTNAVSSFDIQYRAVASGNFTGIFGLGQDGTDVGSILDQLNEVGPTFGLQALFNRNPSVPPSFYFRSAAFGTEYFSLITSEHAHDGDWLTLRLEMNFLSGTAALSFKNLTRQDTEFTLVTALVDLPMELERMHSGAIPELWDTMYIRSAEDGNQSLAFKFDNLHPHVVNAEYLPKIAKIGVENLTVNQKGLYFEFGPFRPGTSWRVESTGELGILPASWTIAGLLDTDDEYRIFRPVNDGPNGTSRIFKIVEIE